jgi:hypothetical protein
MAYSLYIKRPGDAISLNEWTLAIDATENMRIAPTDMHAAANPQTGERIGILKRVGDVEIFDADSGEWHVAILWREKHGEGYFNAAIVSNATGGDPQGDPLWAVIVALAKRLGAQISGEEGELYDFDTAQPKMG